MKKILILLVILLLGSITVFAQVDTVWIPVYTEDFSTDVFGGNPNLVQNPGFENQLNYWDPFQYPSGWSAPMSDNQHFGWRCAKFDFPAGSGYYDASIRNSGYQIYVEAGVPYYFSFWIREKDTHDTYQTNESIVDPGVVVNDNWYGSGEPQISESWQLISATMTFPESGNAVVHFELHGYATSDSAEFAVDDVILEKLGSGDWVRSDTSVWVDTTNGWLNIGNNGIAADYTMKTGGFTVPISVETRMRLVSGGQGYRLPDLRIYCNIEPDKAINITYLPSDGSIKWGWKLNYWTDIHTLAPESENVWRTIKAIIRSDGGELWAKSDTDTAFTFIVDTSWSFTDNIVRVGYNQPWDAICEMDYITVSICDTVPDSFSLASPIHEDSVESPVTFVWQPSIDPDPDDTVWYDLYLSRSFVFNTDSTDTIKALLDTTYTDSLDKKLWYWKVRAYDTWGAERWSDETWSFYVFECGDVNEDSTVNLADAICLSNHYFGGDCQILPKASDVNCEAGANLGDAIIIANYYFGKPGFELNCCP